ncbi:hypothetical protein SHIRM173S_12743 [Streptomyces hirsutus]
MPRVRGMRHRPGLRDQQPAGLFGRVRHSDRPGDHHVRLARPDGRAEVLPVAVDAAPHPVPAAKVADDHGQARAGGDRRALAHGQHERRHGQALGRPGVHSGGGGAAEPAEQLVDLGAEVLGVVLATSQGLAHPVGEADGAAQAHIDAPGEKRLQYPELLGHDERLMIGQHDPAGADADRPGRRGDGGGQYGRRGAGDSGHAVVLRDPEAVVAELLQLPRQAHGVAQRLGTAVSLAGAGAVEDGEAGRGDHRAHTRFNTCRARRFLTARCCGRGGTGSPGRNAVSRRPAGRGCPGSSPGRGPGRHRP